MLFQKPYTYKKGLTARDRLVMAPMTTYSGNPDFTVSDAELEYYRLRSQTIGTVITAATSVSDAAQAFPLQMSLKADRYIPSQKQLASTIQAEGALAITQLHHGGRMNDPSLHADMTNIVSASAVPAARPNSVIPRALTIKEVEATIDDFAQAVRRAIEAGFDGAELHGANTYLLQQFFSPHSNRRTDAYGGSLTKRMTFANALIDACQTVITQHATKPFLLGYRFSPEELEEPGITLEDTEAFVQFLMTKDLDFLHISLRHFNQSSARNSEDKTSIVSRLKPLIANKVPFFGVGGIESLEDVETALQSGYDFVATGMTLLADPKWGKRLRTKEKPKKVLDSKTMPDPLYARLKRNKAYFEPKGYRFND